MAGLCVCDYEPPGSLKGNCKYVLYVFVHIQRINMMADLEILKGLHHLVNRAGLYNAMEELGFPHKLIRLVKATMENSQCCVKIQTDLSDKFTTKDGLRQGHVKRMDECEIPRKVMEYGIAGGRRVGRAKLRWMDCVMNDIKRLGVKNWWTVAKDRDRWRRILKEVEARSGL
ncbi:hypothetical protein ANN_23388 [Periplaneta americana]|uniref:Uncharacterized protein n=1 Tax=Periplaneta americana TaxID=6978 RepID=A0ABQ8SL05_PERAM|nr:hypothetical protein ANN_23388 [Periplaneta americana]